MKYVSVQTYILHSLLQWQTQRSVNHHVRCSEPTERTVRLLSNRVFRRLFQEFSKESWLSWKYILHISGYATVSKFRVVTKICVSFEISIIKQFDTFYFSSDRNWFIEHVDSRTDGRTSPVRKCTRLCIRMSMPYGFNRLTHNYGVQYRSEFKQRAKIIQIAVV